MEEEGERAEKASAQRGASRRKKKKKKGRRRKEIGVATLSLRFFSRCLRTETAFLMR